MSKPKVFISYSWDSEEHKYWVLELAERLTRNGIYVNLDVWRTAPGDSITQFMEKAIMESDFTLVICTKKYYEKSIGRQDGVGYEQQIISSYLLRNRNSRQFIPIVKEGEFSSKENCFIPLFLLGMISIGMREIDDFESAFENLLRAIYKMPKFVAPELGNKPSFLFQEEKHEIKEDGIHLSSLSENGWHLLSGVSQHNSTPETFWIPSEFDRDSLAEGDFVKLMFEIENVNDDSLINNFTERMWVIIKARIGPYYIGALNNHPISIMKKKQLKCGDSVLFLPEHIIKINKRKRLKSRIL